MNWCQIWNGFMNWYDKYVFGENPKERSKVVSKATIFFIPFLIGIAIVMIIPIRAIVIVLKAPFRGGMGDKSIFLTYYLIVMTSGIIATLVSINPSVRGYTFVGMSVTEILLWFIGLVAIIRIEGILKVIRTFCIKYLTSYCPIGTEEDKCTFYLQRGDGKYGCEHKELNRLNKAISLSVGRTVPFPSITKICNNRLICRFRQEDAGA